MTEDINSEQQNISKINSAGIVNLTLNELWKDFFRHYRDGKYLSANSDLDCVWTILGGEKGIEGQDIDKNYNKIETKLAEIGSPQDKLEAVGFKKVDSSQLTKFSKHKTILLEKSLFLRRLQNSQGKGTAYDDADEGDFD